MQNFLQNISVPLVMDFKLGKLPFSPRLLAPHRLEKRTRKAMQSTSWRYNFRTSGIAWSLLGGEFRVSRQQDHVISYEQLKRQVGQLAGLWRVDLQQLERKLARLRDILTRERLCLRGSSVLVFKDFSADEVFVKLVDFTYWEKTETAGNCEDVLNGIENLSLMIRRGQTIHG